jgi:hypothetical protein
VLKLLCAWSCITTVLHIIVEVSIAITETIRLQAHELIVDTFGGAESKSIEELVWGSRLVFNIIIILEFIKEYWGVSTAIFSDFEVFWEVKTFVIIREVDVIKTIWLSWE